MDAKKLEKAEAKLQQKQEKRVGNESAGRVNNVVIQGIEAASASQMMSKKDSRMETKGSVNKTQDIRIENFDVAYGDRILLQAADLTLAFGRRYGLIGRNGLGKTTLLRMISRYDGSAISVKCRGRWNDLISFTMSFLTIAVNS